MGSIMAQIALAKQSYVSPTPISTTHGERPFRGEWDSPRLLAKEPDGTASRAGVSRRPAKLDIAQGDDRSWSNSDNTGMVRLHGIRTIEVDCFHYGEAGLRPVEIKRRRARGAIDGDKCAPPFFIGKGRSQEVL